MNLIYTFNLAKSLFILYSYNFSFIKSVDILLDLLLVLVLVLVTKTTLVAINFRNST